MSNHTPHLSAHVRHPHGSSSAPSAGSIDVRSASDLDIAKRAPNGHTRSSRHVAVSMALISRIGRTQAGNSPPSISLNAESECRVRFPGQVA
jgi:hypothetical protein